MPSDQSSDRFADVVDRRNFMRLAGVSGAAMLAGCGSGDTTTEGDGTDNGSGDGTDVYDVTVESAAAQTMDMLDWNAQFGGWPNIWGRWLAFERFAQYDLSNNEWIPRLIQDWSVEGTTVTLNIRDPHNYADGEAVTAADVKANIVMNLATGAAFADIFESFNEPDEKTLEIETSEEVNQQILEFTILSQLLQARMAEPYQGFYERFWENDEDGVGPDIQERSPGEPDYVSGIFGLQEMDDEQYLMGRNPEHPDAGNVNFERYRFPTFQGNQNKWNAMTNDQVDTVMSVFTPAHIRLQLAEHWQEYSFPGYWGYGLLPQHDSEYDAHISKRPVRQAITHAITREDVAAAAGPQVKTAAPTPAAIASNVQSEWIDVGGTFSEMQGGTEAVTSLMQDAGYERNSDDVWAMDGNTVSFDVAVPGGWSDWVTMTQALVSQLTAAGFGAQMNRVNDIYSHVNGEQGGLACRPWLPGNARSSFPYFPLNHVFGRADGNAHNYPGWGTTPDEADPVEVPTMGGSGTMEVNVKQKLSDLSTARDQATIESLVEELAWVSHQDLPMIPIVTKREQSFISEANLSAPGQDAPEGNVKWPCMYAPRTGAMQWQGE